MPPIALRYKRVFGESIFSKLNTLKILNPSRNPGINEFLQMRSTARDIVGWIKFLLQILEDLLLSDPEKQCL